jgi:hypothetical protein
MGVHDKDAAGDWSQCIYQLSHETVHLLDMTVASVANALEGAAVAFSAHAAKMFVSTCEEGRMPLSTRRRSCQAAPGGDFVAAKMLRQAAGSSPSDRRAFAHVHVDDAAAYLAPCRSNDRPLASFVRSVP